MNGREGINRGRYRRNLATAAGAALRLLKKGERLGKGRLQLARGHKREGEKRARRKGAVNKVASRTFQDPFCPVT